MAKRGAGPAQVPDELLAARQGDFSSGADRCLSRTQAAHASQSGGSMSAATSVAAGRPTLCRFLDPLQVALPPALGARRPVRGIARGRLLEDSPALRAAKIIGMAGVYGGDIHS